MFIHGKKCAELRYRYPEPVTPLCLHILFRKFRDRAITGHYLHYSLSFTGILWPVRLVTARSMSAAGTCFVCGFARPTAAGIPEFQGGHAGIPVAAVAFTGFMVFTACAGVFSAALLWCGCRWMILDGFGFVWFCHGVTVSTVSRTIITHMRINHLYYGTLTWQKQSGRYGRCSQQLFFFPHKAVFPLRHKDLKPCTFPVDAAFLHRKPGDGQDFPG